MWGSFASGLLSAAGRLASARVLTPLQLRVGYLHHTVWYSAMPPTARVDAWPFAGLRLWVRWRSGAHWRLA